MNTRTLCLALCFFCAATDLAVQRHIGRWSEPPARIPTPMMFDSPLVGNGDAGMTFGGLPNSTVFYLSSNQFWSADSHVDNPPMSGTNVTHQLGAESYTQVRIGDITLTAPALTAGTTRYGASQELYAARINGTYTGEQC